MICHYWYFLDDNYKYETNVCNGCYGISMMVYKLQSITILNVKGIGYGCVMWNLSRNDAISRLNNSTLDDKGSL